MASLLLSLRQSYIKCNPFLKETAHGFAFDCKADFDIDGTIN